MKLYLLPLPTHNTSIAMLALEELELDYATVTVDPRNGDNRTPEFLTVSPLGKVPVLEVDGFSVCESMAIARYVSALSGNALYGGSHEARAMTDQWADLMRLQTGRAIASAYRESFLKPVIFKQATDEAALAAAGDQLAAELPEFDRRLRDAQYFGGRAYSLADTTILSYLMALEKTPFGFATLDALSAWYTSSLARPATERMLAHFDVSR